ncbi:MAG TPA: serine/threonine-protein kinase [Ideonella sp.]|nr:serine/threonine-protein kinase [Ideonella sp.]
MAIGGFLLVRTIAQGAMGELHMATDPATGEPVALKTVRIRGGPITRERFLREASAAARLRHPGIVQVRAAGIEDGAAESLGWIAMEWVSGSDLGRYTAASRLLPEPLVLEIAARVADALAEAHRRGVVHRDIKPANLLVNIASGVVKVSDFGCAQLNEAERSRSGLMIGSPAYMAPEQLAGARVDGRADLYALGVVLFELLTGRLPFAADSLALLFTAIAQEPAPRLSTLRPELPAGLSELVGRALAKEPAGRPADAGAMAAELRRVAAAWSVPPGTDPPQTEATPPAAPSRSRGTMADPPTHPPERRDHPA